MERRSAGVETVQAQGWSDPVVAGYISNERCSEDIDNVQR